MPEVSVLIGAFNNAATLPRAIHSILSQSVRELELLVIDDGSRDASAQIAREAAERDDRVRVMEMGENVGISRSLNTGIEEARAAFVAVQDADDFSEPQRLERQLAVLRDDPQVAVVGSRMREVDARGRELAPRTRFLAGEVNGVLMHYNPIPNSCACMRADVVRALGGYDARYRYATEYDLWLRIAEHWRVLALDEPLCTRTMSGENVAATAERAQTVEAIAIRLRALRRRRTLRGAGGLLLPALSLVTPTSLKRVRRRRLGQAP